MRLIDADKLPYKLGVYESGKQMVYVDSKDIDNAPEVFKWIPVSEKMPEIAGYPVLVVAENSYGQKRVVQAFTGYGFPIEFETNNKEFCMTWKSAWKVTHWMPLPELPRDAEMDGVKDDEEN